MRVLRVGLGLALLGALGYMVYRIWSRPKPVSAATTGADSTWVLLVTDWHADGPGGLDATTGAEVPRAGLTGLGETHD